MKKINIAIVAIILIALHALIFYALLANRKQKEKVTIAAPVPTAITPTATPTEPVDPLAGFIIPKFTVPGETFEPEPVFTRETIAVPGHVEGYLRSDRPNNRTTKVFPKLVGNPYRGAIVVDARTGKILFEDHATTYAYPASITKLMTLLIVLDQIDAGVVHLSDKVAITKAGLGVGGSQIYLDIRESGAFTVNDLLNAIVIHSACDAARILGIHVAGSKEAFVDMMNQKARELGMNSTRFHSEHGLPPTNGTQPDISTPYDIAILCLACLRHPETLGYTKTKLTYLPLSPIRKERFMLANRNALVGKDPYLGCDGLKTGYHGMGGWSLAATAKHGNQRVIAIVLGSPDKKTRNATTRKLLDKGFERLK
jgi:D-alanyl-D-alanine carboxypeptidase (penicillin-binding protein 5/6)